MKDARMIYDAWMALRASGLHALELAGRLDVTECVMLASACGRTGGPEVQRLEATWTELIAQLPRLGLVKAITRNPNAVIEVEGRYDDVQFFGGGAMGQSLGTIDLRIFATRWKSGFAVRDETKRGTTRSLQFFDEAGTAIHKLYLRPESNHAAFDALVSQYRSANQEPAQTVLGPALPAPPRADGELDVTGLLAAWSAMKDTHDFFGILGKFGAARTQALRLAAGLHTTRAPVTSVDSLLRIVAERSVPIMVFVGNRGVIQIHTAVPKRVVVRDGWLNVLDPGFDLHLRQDRVTESWIVRKPTADGIVTSLEVYSSDGEQITHLVGKRKPGMPESLGWRDALAALA